MRVRSFYTGVIGLALFSITGREEASNLGTPWLVISFVCVITGVMGGNHHYGK
jgi:uncharacterized membrane protein YeiH